MKIKKKEKKLPSGRILVRSSSYTGRIYLRAPSLSCLNGLNRDDDDESSSRVSLSRSIYLGRKQISLLLLPRKRKIGIK